ncbi:MAG: O-methyltransferase [Pirellulaceae bacterium]
MDDAVWKERLEGLLQRLHDSGVAHDADAQERAQKMLSITPDTGQFLVWMIRAHRIGRVLELGTSCGYSTLWIASALVERGGVVVSVERQTWKRDLARENLHQSGLPPETVELHLGEAEDFLKQCAPKSFDLIFLDCDRHQYALWFPHFQEILKPHRWLIADNATSHPEEIQGLEAVLQEAGWPWVVLPIGKGQLVAQAPAQ